MKILVCGDSWTEAWGVKHPWPIFLNEEIENVAQSGASNDNIAKQFEENYNSTYDLVIIGWSGATRIPNPNNKESGLYEFSLVNDATISFYKNKNLKDILLYWQRNIERVLEIAKVPVIQFSVFGDNPLKNYENFISISCLEYLANKQGHRFQHTIPIFEFDWLSNRNYRFTKKFAKNNFPRNWQKACVERENIRPGKYFLECGHPTKKGHKVWGTYIKKYISDL